MLDEYLKDDMIVVSPLHTKMEILKKIQTQKEFYNIKFMTKEEFFQEYYFSYDERAYCYLQEKYHYHLDVCKVYLKNLYIIEDSKKYQNKKLKKLKQLKKELKEAGLLKENPLFSNFLKGRNILVYQYEILEKKERETLEQLNATFLIEKPSYPLPKVIKRARTLEEEVVYVAISIRKLIKDHVALSNIHLVQVTDDYYYTLKRVFKYFQIPLQEIASEPLISTPVVADYLKKEEFNEKDTSSINKQLLSILNSISHLEEGESKRNILIDKLKHTSIRKEKKENVVQISNLEDTFTEEDYVFQLGVNQDLFPKLRADDDYILDAEKKEVSLYLTDEKNKMIKEKAKNDLQRIPHLFLSYKLESAFQTFYKSNFIEELGIKEEKIEEEMFSYSNLYNKLILAEALDDYKKFGTIHPALPALYKKYPSIPYHTYSSIFTGVEEKTLKEFLQPALKLSYTHLQNYYLCGFKYYVNHILRLDPFESNFASTIGNMFHEALKYMYCDDFDLDYFMVKFLEREEFNAKEKFFLTLLKKDLKKTISIIQEQREYTKFYDAYLEKTVQVPLEEKGLSVVLKGTIDKIMYYQNVSDTFYAVIDYKSGAYDTNLKKMKFGLNMQLPIYLYLIEKSHLFPNSIFTGFYYQKLLLPKKSYDKKEETLKLEGYSCDRKEVLEIFDNSYLKSDIIKGLAVKQSGEFYSSSKLLSSEDVADVLKAVEQKVIEAKDHILKGDFAINPKYLEKENISCKYCKYKDLCFMKEKDLVYLTLEETNE